MNVWPSKKCCVLLSALVLIAATPTAIAATCVGDLDASYKSIKALKWISDRFPLSIPAINLMVFKNLLFAAFLFAPTAFAENDPALNSAMTKCMRRHASYERTTDYQPNSDSQFLDKYDVFFDSGDELIKILKTKTIEEIFSRMMRSDGRFHYNSFAELQSLIERESPPAIISRMADRANLTNEETAALKAYVFEHIK